MHEQTIGQFLDALASGAPTPGGGAVAALSAATGAALVEMVCHLTIGRETYKEHEATMTRVLPDATALRMQAVALATEDAAVYGTVRAAYALPRDTDDQKAVRHQAIQDALRRATDVPLRIMACAARIVDLCAEIADGANTNAISDVEVGVLQASAALDGAACNVRINVPLIDDETFTRASRDTMTHHLKTSRDAIATVRATVERSIGA